MGFQPNPKPPTSVLLAPTPEQSAVFAERARVSAIAHNGALVAAERITDPAEIRAKVQAWLARVEPEADPLDVAYGLSAAIGALRYAQRSPRAKKPLPASTRGGRFRLGSRGEDFVMSPAAVILPDVGEVAFEAPVKVFHTWQVHPWSGSARCGVINPGTSAAREVWTARFEFTADPLVARFTDDAPMPDFDSAFGEGEEA